MKTIPVNLEADYQQATSSIAHILRFQRLDGAVYGFTSASESATISGVLCSSEQGLDVTNFVNSSGLEVDNMELTTLDDGTTFLQGEVMSGLWRGASFWLAKYNWKTPANGVDVLMAGTVGNVQIRADTVMAELRGLQQFLQQSVANVTSKTCRARLGDELCRKDLGAFTFLDSVDTVNSQQSFYAASLNQVSDFFGNGTIEWLTGDNAGLRFLIKTFASGVVTTAVPTFLPIQVGDQFRIIAGCRFRLEEDCFTKFDNVLNFQGEPHLPGIDEIMSPPA